MLIRRTWFMFQMVPVAIAFSVLLNVGFSAVQHSTYWEHRRARVEQQQLEDFRKKVEQGTATPLFGDKGVIPPFMRRDG
ncbi:hypothetical protein H696_03033 [Fonticula alba]|uniref:Uncharacterized protein n=1 Tax=Fonticula alba TaxID=691883 RepID=A0A058Z9S1_FONAL|nr:hypothetical protein H696_03033 [Fonticula alba]KCV70678.1 hypothetical protein H696_03033 [Fonticula alba]|eukprot:XP_009495194.1 hypothetical protein H696_03033 [Fonticula alba]